MDDYLFKLSCAQIQFMAVDNTHTKYLKGGDKKAWNNYAETIKAQTKLGKFLDGFSVPTLGKGEEYEVPIKKNQSTKIKK